MKNPYDVIEIVEFKTDLELHYEHCLSLEIHHKIGVECITAFQLFMAAQYLVETVRQDAIKNKEDI